MSFCCGSSAGAKQDAQLSRELRESEKKRRNEVKLLLLGAGESGKSTIAKQMKIIHMGGFSMDDRRSYVPVIHQNVHVAIRSLCSAVSNLGIAWDSDALADDAAQVVSKGEGSGEVLTRDNAERFARLWQCEAVQAAYRQRSSFQLTDSAAFYLDKVESLVSDDWVPSEEDVIRSRAKTTGIIETNFTVDQLDITLVDVGGQRSERKKWLHCFEDVTAVLFCVALTEYNQTLYEDDSTNRLEESLTLFEEICNSQWFVDTAILLFLNKKVEPLSQTYPDFHGSSYDDSVKYLQDKFLALNKDTSKTIFVHQTTATNTENVKYVFNALKSIILDRMIKDVQF